MKLKENTKLLPQKRTFYSLFAATPTTPTAIFLAELKEYLTAWELILDKTAFDNNIIKILKHLMNDQGKLFSELKEGESKYLRRNNLYNKKRKLIAAGSHLPYSLQIKRVNNEFQLLIGIKRSAKDPKLVGWVRSGSSKKVKYSLKFTRHQLSVVTEAVVVGGLIEDTDKEVKLVSKINSPDVLRLEPSAIYTNFDKTSYRYQLKGSFHSAEATGGTMRELVNSDLRDFDFGNFYHSLCQYQGLTSCSCCRNPSSRHQFNKYFTVS
jgi:hypothetical protein